MSEAARQFVKQMASLSQREWDRALKEIMAAIHPVDRSATLIWFRFWPLRLCEALENSPDPQQVAQQMELDGRWDLSQQIDTSISFFYGARFWPSVKKAVLERASHPSLKGDEGLAEHIRQAGGQAAQQAGVEQTLTLGISAAALMILRQVGWDAFSRAAANTSNGPGDSRAPQKVLKSRQQGKGLLGFFKGSARRHRVQWEERRPGAHFEALEGQDISGAAASDKRDYREMDPRRIEGPIPAQCRSAACGYCWIGILEGEQNIDPVSAFEQRRLHYFGYHPRDGEPQPYPLIRLACQSKCRGDVTLVVPPWNGVLDGQR